MKKKSNNIFIRLFSSIGRFFDKVLITPLTKLFFKFGEWINDGGRFFDKMMMLQLINMLKYYINNL